jgi:hypothetical protein
MLNELQETQPNGSWQLLVSIFGCCVQSFESFREEWLKLEAINGMYLSTGKKDLVDLRYSFLYEGPRKIDAIEQERRRNR